jgi:hypothetical protein
MLCLHCCYRTFRDRLQSNGAVIHLFDIHCLNCRDGRVVDELEGTGGMDNRIFSLDELRKIEDWVFPH